jgi:hypothetical protein
MEPSGGLGGGQVFPARAFPAEMRVKQYFWALFTFWVTFWVSKASKVTLEPAVEAVPRLSGLLCPNDQFPHIGKVGGRK